MSDLDSKRPLLPADYLFPIEPVTSELSQFPTLKNKIHSCDTPEALSLDPHEHSKLRFELEQMRAELVAKQQFYLQQFETLKQWMVTSFGVESPQVLIDHQAKVKEAELAAEETMFQGNSKQHIRIRTLSLNVASNSDEKPQAIQDDEEDGRSEEATSVTETPHRAAKNLSRMNAPASSSKTTAASASSVPQPQGQKDLSAIKNTKVTNQIPINVFWNYIEAFFKPIDEDDLKFLDDSSHVLDVAPFTIPPLGSHYENIWYEQYGYVVPGSEARRNSHAHSVEPSPVPLRERLLSALNDKCASLESLQDCDGFEVADGSSHSYEQANPLTSIHLNDRIKGSLQELGFVDMKSSRDYREDDEICVEMRAVQKQLREQIVINQYRKRRLAEFIRSKLAGQEFHALVGDIEKQIDSTFQRRIKNAKKKKKTTANATAAVDSAPEIPQEALQCLENRRKLLDSFADMVPSRVEVLNPNDHVDFDPQVEENIIEAARKSSTWMPLPDIPLKQQLSIAQPAFPSIKRS